MDRISTLTNRTRDGLEQTRVPAVSPVVIAVCSAPGHQVVASSVVACTVVANPAVTGFDTRWGMTTKCPARLLGTST